MILFNQVSKQNGDKHVLKDLTFNINRDEFVFIFGQDNKALQVLRKLLSGTEKPDNGIIRIFNKYVGKNNISSSEIGIVYKKNILLFERSIKENLKFILNVQDLNMKYYRYRIKKVLDIVNLRQHQQRKPDKLLPHQLVRANIAQAMLTYPSLLILEDITYKLDEVNSRAIFKLLQEINNLGTTVVFLSSDRGLLTANRKKRIIYLKEGEILSEKKAKNRVK